LQEAAPNAYSTLSKTQPRPEDPPFRICSPWLLGVAFRKHLEPPALLGLFEERCKWAWLFMTRKKRLKFLWRFVERKSGRDRRLPCSRIKTGEKLSFT